MRITLQEFNHLIKDKFLQYVTDVAVDDAIWYLPKIRFQIRGIYFVYEINVRVWEQGDCSGCNSTELQIRIPQTTDFPEVYGTLNIVNKWIYKIDDYVNDLIPKVDTFSHNK